MSDIERLIHIRHRILRLKSKRISTCDDEPELLRVDREIDRLESIEMGPDLARLERIVEAQELLAKKITTALSEE